MIYALRDNVGNVKIGFTRTRKLLKARIAALQTAHASRLELLCAVNGWPVHEARLHKFLAPHRRGGEWFDGSAELVCVVVHLLEGYGPAFILEHTAEQLLAFCPIGRRFPNWSAFPVVANA